MGTIMGGSHLTADAVAVRAGSLYSASQGLRLGLGLGSGLGQGSRPASCILPCWVHAWG